MDNLAIRVKDIHIQLYCAAGGVGLPLMDFNKYYNVTMPSY